MNLKEFDDRLQGRIVAVRRMAKVDVVGARMEVDQLRREFVSCLAATEGQWTPVGLPREIARELEELDKFDMPEEREHPQPVTEDEAGNLIPRERHGAEPKLTAEQWVTRQWARAGKGKRMGEPESYEHPSDEGE